jgi:hypothetical protein
MPPSTTPAASFPPLSDPSARTSSAASAAGTQGSDRAAAAAASTPESPAKAGNPQGVAGLTLPSNCEAIRPETGVSVILCSAPSESFLTKLAPSTPSIVLSIVAIVLSVMSYFYTRRKDSRARQQSIQDDFWLRKVVSPVSIEPFLQFGTELLTKLPASDNDPAAARPAGAELLQKLRGLTQSFLALQLIGDNLHLEVEAALEKLEDRLATYLGGLDEHWNNSSPAPSRPEAIAELSLAFIAVLNPIKQHQASLGFEREP